MKKSLIFLSLTLSLCQSPGFLVVEGAINSGLKEVSANEIAPNDNLIWVIEDSGNDNHLYGLDKKGKLIRDITITNAKNKDWEDLTIDKKGNIYIGDFGNNKLSRKHFNIYKIDHKDLANDKVKAKLIEFSLPKVKKSKDFEAFFILNNHFYIFSKEKNGTLVFKVPNKVGKHKAIVKSDYKFEDKHTRITSADIDRNGKVVVLLNHDKLWKLSGFKDDNFFSGTVKKLMFNHMTQKEGVCFKNDSIVLITDEFDGFEGGNIYSFNIN